MASGGYSDENPIRPEDLVEAHVEVTDPPQNPDGSDSSDASSDGSESESDGTEDEEASPKSADHQHHQRSPKNDPDASSSVVASDGTTSQQVVPVIEVFCDEDFEAMVALAMKSKEEKELEKLVKNSELRWKYFYSKQIEIGKHYRKVKRAREKKERDEKKKIEKSEAPEKKTTITLNIKKPDGSSFSITIGSRGTVKTVRDTIFALNPTLYSKKALKSMRYMVGESTMNDHPRRELTSKDGWGLKDGDTIVMNPRGQGGGKRGLASIALGRGKDDVLKNLEESVVMGILRCNASAGTSPLIDNLINIVKNIMASAKTEQLNMDVFLQSLNDQEMEKLLTVTSVSTKVESRCKAIADVVFKGHLNHLIEIKSQLDASFNILPLVIQYLLLQKFGDQGANIGWAVFTSSVSNIIKSKASASSREDVQMGGSADIEM